MLLNNKFFFGYNNKHTLVDSIEVRDVFVCRMIHSVAHDNECRLILFSLLRYVSQMEHDMEVCKN